MNAQVIIGAGYGDEGKGLATDWICSRNEKQSLVVRFNGGAQAGHTVVTPEGQRYIFSHIGSGSFTGAATYLSRFMVCHPMMFRTEIEELLEINISPTIFAHPRAMVTTPYDVMINQALEMSRGNKRHGSCGLGFGETIERHEKGYRLSVEDLADTNKVYDVVKTIRDDYLPYRWRSLNLPEIEESWLSDEILKRYLEDVDFFCSRVYVSFLSPIKQFYDIVFEGAQGLMLDMDYGAFPYVTRSNTGLQNVISIALESGIDNLDVTYVTRCYVTRHGAGPLENELSEPPYKKVVDITNQTNDWQEKLRFAWLDVDVLSSAILNDLKIGSHRINTTQILVTCLDQIQDNHHFFVQSGKTKRQSTEDFLQSISDSVNCEVIYCNGPTRKGIIDECNIPKRKKEKGKV